MGHSFLSAVLTPCETRKYLQLRDASFLFFIVFLLNFFHAKSHSGMGRDPIQHVTIIYLSVKNTGWLTDQADHAVCLCLNRTALTAHIQWKWFLISGLTLHKHDWIGLASQHMSPKKSVAGYISKYPEDAFMVYRAGTSYTTTIKWVGFGKDFDFLCQKNISVPLRGT